MQEVTGSSPVSPTTTRRERRAGRAARSGSPENRVTAASPTITPHRYHPRAAGEPARESPDSATHECTTTVVKAGGTAGEDLSSCRRTRGLVILRRRRR